MSLAEGPSVSEIKPIIQGAELTPSVTLNCMLALPGLSVANNNCA